MTVGAGTIGATPVGGVQRRGEARTASVSIHDTDALSAAGTHTRLASASATDTDALISVATRTRTASASIHVGAGTIGALPVGGVHRRGEARTASESIHDTDTLTAVGFFDAAGPIVRNPATVVFDASRERVSVAFDPTLPPVELVVETARIE